MFTTKTKIQQTITIISTLIPILTSAASGADRDSFWPQFHGPNRDNISTEKGLLKNWPDNGPDLLWTTRGLGHGYSSISIANAMIYTASSIEDDTVVIALNMDGKVLESEKRPGLGWKRPRQSSGKSWNSNNRWKQTISPKPSRKSYLLER